MQRKDGCKSWLVLIAVTFCVFLETGVIKGLSVLLPTLKEQFATDTWVVGSSIAIITALGYLIGLSADVLVKLLSPRVCVMLTGISASVGLLICSMAANSLYVLLCGLTLTGFLLLQENIFMGLIPDYFEQHFSTAVGIYSCGAGLGITILPLLTQFILDEYGWRSTVLLLGAITFHSVPCGAILKQETNLKESQPLITHKNKAKNTVFKLREELVRTYSSGSELLTNVAYISKVLVPGFVLGYTLIGWIIYIVYFAVSRGATIKEASIVSSCGGIGIVIIRLTMPIVLRVITYKHLLCISSVCLALSLFITSLLHWYVHLSMVSFAFGLCMGAHGGSIYISAKMNSKQSENYHAISIMHLAYGIASILSGYVTGVLYDITGSFTLSFNILAGISLLTALSVGVGDLLEKRK